MASTYVLPGTTMPTSHRHHGHKHGHSRSRSPSSLGSLNRSFKMDSSFGIPSPSLDDEHDDEHDHDHDHGHSHSHSHSHSEPHTHDHGSSHSHTHPANSMQPRQNIPAPLLPSNGWKTTSTSMGKHLITPITASISEQYEAPETQGSEPPHDHSAERSRFTNMLLPYTSKWPILHAVMTEKDSRRIFYFMRYESGEISHGGNNMLMSYF